MGFEINVRSNAPKRGWKLRRPGRDALFNDIREVVEQASQDRLLRVALQWESRDQTLALFLHPAASPIEFTWEPNGAVRASVKTSPEGPGFHAYAVEVLDEVERRCGLKWQWRDADETNYAVTRDFAALQEAMADYLRGLARVLLEQGPGTSCSFALHWPLGWPRPCDVGFAYSPSGPWPRDWFERAATAGDDPLFAMCEEFFPWWRRERNGLFWANVGRVLLWSSIPWHPPANDHERAVCRVALDAYRRAQELDASIELPSVELDELQRLSVADMTETTEPPQPVGIGFRRRTIFARGTGDWTVRIPGYFYDSVEEDGSTAVFWFGERTVRLSSLEVGGKSAAVPTPDELLAGRVSGGINFEFDRGHLKGQASIGKSSEDGKDFWMLQGRVATTGKLCFVTACFDDPEDQDWAVEVFKSVTHPGPAE